MVRPIARKSIRSSPSNKHARKQSTPVKVAPKPLHILSRLRKIKKNGEYLIPNAPFFRVVKDILTDTALNVRNDIKYFKIQRAALEALKVSAEAYMIQLFEDMELLVTHAGRKTLMMKDFILIKRLRASIGDRTMLAAQSENKRF
uniref:Histone H2A/H2B/H3 domain-containing protein n=1 Tax=Panagrolaimus sp. ES5 TaxID=591445 RepID=A0AC34FVY2_9BILA